ncbi:PadR family transcriptional regulator [Breznakiella homolactica]|uniref:PadR family transcriptional regulator n=1 Tax=Breznakiella homolactica TaxID=2798577 RepID=A0A7T7XNZ4_9SPIR|nr:PadR family transcriptional regulator [Breznakiella homolactica]QQO09849.1 PadR family transcriptional regulator [Breznakiella homolactica]
MSAIDLILLGLVLEQPRSAYEIQKQIEYRNIGKWVRISSPSVYKKVLVLEQKGYLESRAVRESRMPEKTVYSVTGEGHRHFLSLMETTAAAPVQAVFDFNAVIANLHKIPKQDALRLLSAIEENIRTIKDELDTYLAERQHIPLPGMAVMDQQKGIFESLLAWIGGFRQKFRKAPLSGPDGNPPRNGSGHPPRTA